MGHGCFSPLVFNHYIQLPSGKLTYSNYAKSPFLMGKSTISMAIFNCYVCLPEGSINYIVVVGSLESCRPLYRRLLPDIVRFALFCLWFQNIGRDYSHIIWES